MLSFHYSSYYNINIAINHTKGGYIMKKYISVAISVMIIMLASLTGCQSRNKTAVASKNQSFVIHDSFEGKSLKSNMIKENTKRELIIYLPPSYYTSNKRYPVVYFLHGFQETPGIISYYYQSLDKQMKENGNKEFIIVEPDANNKLQGSFYANSPVTGNWEDYIVKDVVNFVDKKYRTIPNASSRGIAGFSMGGSGTMNIALKYPDIFSAAYIMSPGAFDKNGLKEAMTTWDDTFLNAYGAAFSPNINGKYPYANIPEFNNTPEDNKIVQNWENGFGNLESKIESYKRLNKPLKGIKIVCGTFDSYDWIMEGSAYLSKLLDNAGIKHDYETFAGSHEIDKNFFKKEFVEFFSDNLK